MIVDDHPLWRQTMRQVFEKTERGEVVAEASNGHEAIELARTSRPDVVLMDIDMPGLDGVSATRELSKAHPAAKVLVISASDARADVIGALGAGVSGYLLKTTSASEIRDGVGASPAARSCCRLRLRRTSWSRCAASRLGRDSD